MMNKIIILKSDPKLDDRKPFVLMRIRNMVQIHDEQRSFK